jgi:clan AA aspartic protease (TIGR02281 family)
MKSNSEASASFRDNTFFIALAATILLLGFIAGFLYWRYMPAKVDYARVYEQLGISPLPSSIETLPQIQRRLDQLNREACYRDAIAELSENLIKVGYPREAATSLRSFVKRCKNSEGLLRTAHTALESIGDYQGALEVADQLVEAYPANGTFRYWRAMSYEHIRDFPHALIDYINTIQLANDPKRLVGDVFYNTSRMYAELGRYCDAITPMETYISLDPADRRTPKTTKIIAEYAAKGNCDIGYASGSARIPIPGQSNVHFLRVIVNTEGGNFIVDTGATFVSVTSQFASKARLDTESGNQVIVKTVGGTALADIGYATKIAVGKAEASGVVVAVHRGDAKPFGDGVDGLLGMSFLAPFQLNISPTAIELTPIPLR